MSSRIPRHLLPILEHHLTPRQAEPAGIERALHPLADVRYVAFDVYGTLLTSAAGDITADEPTSRADEWIAAETRLNLADATVVVRGLRTQISRHHERIRAQWVHLPYRQRDGLLQPEVDIREIWRDSIRAVRPDLVPARETIERIALIHELTANPLWTMPEAGKTLRDLLDAGVRCAIVSNAQFYTPVILAYLLGPTLLDRLSPQVWSFETAVAKPSPALYRRLLQSIHRSEPDVEPHSVIFVGNDMLNDVWAAVQCGLRTVLFGGDRASLRLRDADSRVATVRPDAIVTSLSEIPRLITSAGPRLPTAAKGVTA